MNRFTLTEEEKASLELQHLQCKDKKDSDRLKAVLLRSEEWTVPKISQALRVHQTTIIRHINLISRQNCTYVFRNPMN